MNQNAELRAFYDVYYDDAAGGRWEIMARQTVDHIESLCGNVALGSVLDVGAGNGAVIAELERRGLGTDFHAVEISSSGLDQINRRKLKRLKSVQSFDGYKLPFPDDCFDTALLIHVLEHVEHERMLLKEVRRVARRCYVEVPLEHTIRLRQSISAGKSVGHINFYTIKTFENVLDTVRLSPVSLATFAATSEHERHLSGPVVGAIKHAIRSSALEINSSLARRLFVYMAGALCERKETDLLK
jgi:SAM-dependent methyltransferase